MSSVSLLSEWPSYSVFPAIVEGRNKPALERKNPGHKTKQPDIGKVEFQGR